MLSGAKRDCESRRRSKERPEDGSESPVTPDSTTEPPKPVHDFHEGDDVFYQDDTGQKILGTVSRVTPNSCLVSFGDGTEQWAPFRRLRKLGCSFDEPAPPVQASAVEVDTNGSSKSDKVKLTCSTCKLAKHVPLRKVNSQEKFVCAKCCGDGAGTSEAPNMTPKTSGNNTNNFINNIRRISLAASPVKLGTQGKYVNGEVRRSMPPGVPAVKGSRIPTAPGAVASKKHPDVTILNYFKPSPVCRQVSNDCFHCRGPTTPTTRVDCNMCGRHCHLSCLPLQPTPLDGDRFWDLLCSACGTQNGAVRDSSNKVFSVRRSINTWSDVVHLIISCLNAVSGAQQFDLDSQIIPFLEKEMDRLHLPRQYKNTAKDDRKGCMLNALTSSKLRFVKHKGSEFKRASGILWSLNPESQRDSFKDAVKGNMGTNSPLAMSRKSPLRGDHPIHSIATKFMNARMNNVPKQQQPSRSLSNSPNTSSASSSGPSPTNATVGAKTKSPLRSPPPDASNVMLAAAKSVLNKMPGSSSPVHAASKLWQTSPKRGLSIIPIPPPSSSGGTGNTANDAGNIDSLSITVTGSPKVLPKEVIMRTPIMTNIVLSPTRPPPITTYPTNGTSTKTVSSQYKSNDCLSIEKVTSPRLSLNEQRTSPIKSDDRETLKLRITKQLEYKVQSGTTPDENKSLHGTNTSPTAVKGSRGRKRAMPDTSGEESDDEADDGSSSNSSTKKMKIESNLHTEIAVRTSPGYRGNARDPRQKLLRSAVVKNKITQSQKAANALKEKASGRGRGRGRLPQNRKSANLHPPAESIAMECDTEPNTSVTSKKLNNGTSSSRDPKFVRKTRLRKPVATVVATEQESLDSPEPSDKDFATFNENLLQSIIHGGMLVQCLPSLRSNDNQKRNIASYFLDDPDDCSESELMASIDSKNNNVGDAEVMTLQRNRFGKTLEDSDSYEILCSRTGPDGSIEYLVMWHEEVDEGVNLGEDIENAFFPDRSSECIKVEVDPIIIKPEINDSDGYCDPGVETNSSSMNSHPRPTMKLEISELESDNSNYQVVATNGNNSKEKGPAVLLRSNSLTSAPLRTTLRSSID